ncbi:histone acetyltransferase KAT6A-like [Ylistrum balloti]|uniref:histone acetyltransferase KAT6A-like n=1 Tax=Ylistrum balloti TaxID=509963 RepID=UPI002905DD68|nr:histone acetyltransferase KAT6A-like [Ylistrum balloti]
MNPVPRKMFPMDFSKLHLQKLQVCFKRICWTLAGGCYYVYSYYYGFRLRYSYAYMYCPGACCGYYYSRSCCTSGGTIAGAIIGCILFAALIIVIIFMIKRCNRTQTGVVVANPRNNVTNVTTNSHLQAYPPPAHVDAYPPPVPGSYLGGCNPPPQQATGTNYPGGSYPPPPQQVTGTSYPGGSFPPPPPYEQVNPAYPTSPKY